MTQAYNERASPLSPELSPRIYKLGHQVAGQWVEHSYPPLYSVQLTSTGAERVITAAPGSDSAIFRTLTAVLSPPFIFLYVLHTPRGEGNAGRYQSPELSHRDLSRFLDRFGTFLQADARFDLWLHSPADQATLVWDRHNMVYGYGPNSLYVTALHGLGFGTGDLRAPVPHRHCYHAAFDTDARAPLEQMSWIASPLHPEDEQ